MQNEKPDRPETISRIMSQIQSLDRRECIEQLLEFRDIPLDFDPQFLETMSDERLRHILFAAKLAARRHERAGA